MAATSMVFDEGRYAALAIEVMGICSFDVELLADAWIGKCLSSPTPAEIDGDNGQSVVFQQMGQCCIVGSVEDIENDLNHKRPNALHQ